ncbi:uncharacterized protein C8R40DRAFT_1070120 [Lentinula edodes]|uniref:uncharacterized protein n=1 Tax=Lentinula edodes TaxID=5353 RepID=UPI001E8DFE74|nr:uncharacterized protein C8R40DRAFT_1070120 [Lentinula edodes]KAH7874308.1 hypothetical protein C8R40DRAFT_1070120 [Lentinula edodes]
MKEMFRPMLRMVLVMVLVIKGIWERWKNLRMGVYQKAGPGDKIMDSFYGSEEDTEIEISQRSYWRRSFPPQTAEIRSLRDKHCFKLGGVTDERRKTNWLRCFQFHGSFQDRRDRVDIEDAEGRLGVTIEESERMKRERRRRTRRKVMLESSEKRNVGDTWERRYDD